MMKLRIEDANKVMNISGFNSDVKKVLLTGTYSLKAYRMFIRLFNKVEKSHAFNSTDVGFIKFPSLPQFMLYFKSASKKRYMRLSEVTNCTFAKDGQIIIPLNEAKYWYDIDDSYFIDNLKGYFRFFFLKQAHGETKDFMHNMHLLAQLYGFETSEEDHADYIEIVGHPLNPFEAGYLCELNDKFTNVQTELRNAFNDYYDRRWKGGVSRHLLKKLTDLSNESTKLHDKIEDLLSK